MLRVPGARSAGPHAGLGVVPVASSEPASVLRLDRAGRIGGARRCRRSPTTSEPGSGCRCPWSRKTSRPCGRRRESRWRRSCCSAGRCGRRSPSQRSPSTSRSARRPRRGCHGGREHRSAPGRGTLLMRIGFRRQLDRRQDALAIVFVGALASMLISAMIGPGRSWCPARSATTSCRARRRSGGPGTRWESSPWPRSCCACRCSGSCRLVAGALAGGADDPRARGAVITWAAHSDPTLLFLTLPAVGWASWRLQLRGAAPAALVVSLSPQGGGRGCRGVFEHGPCSSRCSRSRPSTPASLSPRSSSPPSSASGTGGRRAGSGDRRARGPRPAVVPPSCPRRTRSSWRRSATIRRTGAAEPRRGAGPTRARDRGDAAAQPASGPAAADPRRGPDRALRARDRRHGGRRRLVRRHPAP